MGLPKVTFTVNTNGTNRPLPGYDHYSMMLAYYKESASNNAYSSIGGKYLSLLDAEEDGIVDTCAEATAAATTANAITAIGTNGDVITLTFDDYEGTTLTLGAYTKVAGDTTVTLVATALVAAINALTYSHGYSATVGAAGAYTITAPKNRGIWPNTKSCTVTLSAGATMTHTNSAFAGGTKSRLAIWHYQISRFFAQNPLGVLWFKPIWDDSANTATQFETQMTQDIVTQQNAFVADNTSAAGCRQFLCYAPDRTFVTTQMTAIKTAMNTLFDNYIPAVGWLFANYSATALSAFTNTRTLSCSGVSMIISQSSTGEGKYVKYCQQASHGSAGEALGSESAANGVSGSIGEVQRINLADGTENESIEFVDSSSSDYLTLQATNPNILGQLNDYGYVFARKIPGLVGTYWNEGNCAVAINNDLAYREGSRTIFKVVRNFYAAIVTLLNAKNYLNSDGTLSEQSTAGYIDRGTPPLRQMAQEGDLSQDPSMNGGIIVSTAPIVAGVIPITLKLIPVVIGREIDVKLGFVAKI